MKNGLILIGIVLVYLLIGNVTVGAIQIPEDAIRLRVVPNSNSSYDQNIKLKVKGLLEQDLYQLLKGTKGSSEARNKIEEYLPTLDEKVGSLLLKEKYSLGYQIHFGQNFFPQKEFQGVKYSEGMYESLLVTLGKGEGDNWWCVLFPPLCLLEAEESEEVEYKFFVQELLEKYL